KPYLIMPRTFVDTEGKKHTIKVGVIGFTLPQTMYLNRRYEKLEGKVKVNDIYKTAKHYIPEMKKKGADVIVALSHSGLGTPEIKFKDSDASYDLTEIDGIDAVMFGHIHKVFPSDDFADIPKVNLKKGTVNGVAAVEAGMWGDHLGVIDLKLKKKGKDWKVVDSHSEARPVFGKKTIKPDPRILKAARQTYKAAMNYSFTPEGAIWHSRRE
ncbi:MAG TPA: metallophosphoesterase, partial [Bacillales bacterium]|nr:metallophosphoesterase [Bacillales bacterium]